MKKQSVVGAWDFTVNQQQACQIQIDSARPLDSAVTAMAHWFDTRPTSELYSVPDHPWPAKTVCLSREHNSWSGTLIPPDSARFLRISVYSWNGVHPGDSRNDLKVKLDQIPIPSPQQVRLAVAYQQHPEHTTAKANLETTCRAILQAGREKAQLVCLSEMFLEAGLSREQKFALAAPIDSERLRPVYETIKEANLYAVFSFLELDHDRFYNTAVLVSPTGEVQGRYRKTHLTFGELWDGYSAGSEYPVFETEIGRIGILICWDGWFPEAALRLNRQRADIICFPVMGDGITNHWTHTWRARAMDNQVYWLASVTGNCGGEAPSQVISPTGDVLASTSKPNSVATSLATLPSVTEIRYLSVGPSFGEWRNILGHSRELDLAPS